MAIGLETSLDSRRFASDVFAASHDFCLMSEEEEGASLSKGYLDYDVKYKPDNMMVPKFLGTHERPPCDSSSEFSGQCLLLSAATAVDYASSCIHASVGDGRSAHSVDKDLKNLLRRSLHRLSQAQEEFLLNCEDEVQKNEVHQMIALLTLRCLLGVGEDSLAYKSMKDHRLGEALRKIHSDDLSASDKKQDDDMGNKYFILKNVFLMAGLAEERKMHLTSRALVRLCAQLLPQTGKVVLDLGDFVLSLGQIQRKIIQSALSIEEVMIVYNEVKSFCLFFSYHLFLRFGSLTFLLFSLNRLINLSKNTMKISKKD